MAKKAKIKRRSHAFTIGRHTYPIRDVSRFYRDKTLEEVISQIVAIQQGADK